MSPTRAGIWAVGLLLTAPAIAQAQTHYLTIRDDTTSAIILHTQQPLQHAPANWLRREVRYVDAAGSVTRTRVLNGNLPPYLRTNRPLD